MNQVILITGGNQGAVEKNIHRAKKLTEAQIGHIVGCSSVHHSKAWGFESTSTFLNQVLILETTLSAHEVLEQIWKIEALFGRQHTDFFDSQGNKIGQDKYTRTNYESRTMDIDILFYNNAIIDDNYLTVPHPLITQRLFVLHPLAEVAGELIHPILKVSVNELLRISLDNEKNG